MCIDHTFAQNMSYVPGHAKGNSSAYKNDREEVLFTLSRGKIAVTPTMSLPGIDPWSSDYEACEVSPMRKQSIQVPLKGQMGANIQSVYAGNVFVEGHGL